MSFLVEFCITDPEEGLSIRPKCPLGTFFLFPFLPSVFPLPPLQTPEAPVFRAPEMAHRIQVLTDLLTSVSPRLRLEEGIMAEKLKGVARQLSTLLREIVNTHGDQEGGMCYVGGWGGEGGGKGESGRGGREGGGEGGKWEGRGEGGKWEGRKGGGEEGRGEGGSGRRGKEGGGGL